MHIKYNFMDEFLFLEQTTQDAVRHSPLKIPILLILLLFVCDCNK